MLVCAHGKGPMEPSALHILIVDDSPEDRLILKRFLTERAPRAYMISEANRGDRALTAFQAEPPDCVLLDYRLPDMDGLAVLTALRAQSDVPVVLLTGVGSETLAVNALQRGAQDYLVKGTITPERLELTIQHAVATARLTRERDQTMAMLSTVLDTLPVGVLVLDAGLRVHQVNPAMAAILGRPVATLPGYTLAQLWPALAEDLAGLCAQVIRGARFSELELRVPAEMGDDEYWLSFSGTPIRGTDGSGPLALITIQDITARWQAEAALSLSEARFRAIIETGTEGLVLLEADGRIAYVSPTIASLLGYRPEAIATLGLRDLCHPDDQPQLDGFLTTLTAQVGARAQVTTRLRHHNGAWRWIAQRGYNQTDFPALAAIIVSFHDVTAQMQTAAETLDRLNALAADAAILSKTNAELTRALHLKDESRETMSHELRTQLNAVLSISEAMSACVYGPLSERQQGALAQLARSGRRILGILPDLLDLAPTDTGAEQLELERVEVGALCLQALQLVADRARQKQIHLLRTVAHGVEALRADERRLIQILVNLLDNAVKFTPAGGSVGLEVVGDVAQEQISFIVWDTGIGIAAEDRDRLFRPFTQGDGSPTRSYEGIGLGLTLVRRLTELHGGSVQLESTPEVGSRFTITLPWSAEDNIQPAAPLAPATLPTWSRPLRIVVADDHEPTLGVYAAQLTHLGCIVATARTGIEAIAQIRARQPDIALLDIQMPEMDGLAVLRHIRADPGLAGLPIIALTALAIPGDRERCLEAGANGYLAKPASLRTLIAMIAELLPSTPADS